MKKTVLKNDRESGKPSGGKDGVPEMAWNRESGVRLLPVTDKLGNTVFKEGDDPHATLLVRPSGSATTFDVAEVDARHLRSSEYIAAGFTGLISFF